MKRVFIFKGFLVGESLVRLLLISLAGLERRYGSEKEGKGRQQDEGNQGREAHP